MDPRVAVRLPSAEEIASPVGRAHDEVLVELERIGRMVHAAKLGAIDHADREALVSGRWASQQPSVDPRGHERRERRRRSFIAA